MDMSTAFLKGSHEYLPNALVSFDRFHVVALANDAMDKARELASKEMGSVTAGLGLPPGLL